MYYGALEYFVLNKFENDAQAFYFELVVVYWFIVKKSCCFFSSIPTHIIGIFKT